MRTFLYIQDAVEAISSMLDRPEKAKNQVFNLGNRANETTMSNLADVVKTTLFEITGNSLYQHYPVSNIKGEVFYGEGYEDSDRRLPDVSKAASLLGWQAKIPLKIGIKTTLSHYVDQGIIS
jgi:UDP-apiose/xylose synthase